LTNLQHANIPISVNDINSTSSNNNDSHDAMISSINQSRPENDYITIHRVSITPTRCVFRPSIPIKSNRLLRRFENRYSFAYITFCDEMENSIFDNKIFTNRYAHILENGFSIDNSLQFHFLLCSASQMREQTAVFVITDSKHVVDDILNELVPNHSTIFKDHAKHMSRLGLFCTSDTPTCDILDDMHCVEEDSYTDTKKILTDGAGRISEYRLNYLKENYPWLVPQHATAVHIRQSGRKGVLTLDNKIVGDMIIFRKSMEKFINNPSKTLCIIKANSCVPLKLNREILNLLFTFSGEGKTGGNWEPLPFILNLQEEELSRLARIMLDWKYSVAEICSNNSYEFYDHLSSINENGVDLLIEPMWRNVLQTMYEYGCRSIRSKTHIPVNDGGCRVIGVPDPSSSLRDDEVYLRILRPNSTTSEVITGKVVIFRNPCLDPGDVRIVTAVSNSKLESYGLTNLLCLPATHNVTKRSLSEECSGGDLDGVSLYRCVPYHACSYSAYFV
jgi:RNA-dependent RNA polymerase